MTKPIWLTAAAVVFLMTDGAGRVLAHQQRLAIGGSTVTLKTDKGPAAQKFLFKAVKQGNISVINHNPALEGSYVLVHGTGPNGGKTGMVALHPGNWKQAAKGWVYKDPDGLFGGIRRIVFRTGNNGGTLKIVARGENWRWAPTEPQDEVWVQFKTENEWFCARFGGEVTRNQPGFFKARKAPAAVGGCPEVCGNGEIDQGEECDDGNLNDNDGCTSE